MEVIEGYQIKVNSEGTYDAVEIYAGMSAGEALDQYIKKHPVSIEGFIATVRLLEIEAPEREHSLSRHIMEQEPTEEERRYLKRVEVYERFFRAVENLLHVVDHGPDSQRGSLLEAANAVRGVQAEIRGTREERS